MLYVDEGDVLTSAGTAAGIDLCLHVVRLDFGADVANAVARRMVVPPHRDGGQAQYVDQPVACISEECESDELRRVLEWMESHLESPLSVEALARRANMSPRHFARQFRAITGTTPHQWLLAQRVLLAQRLLETTDDSVERIADALRHGLRRQPAAALPARHRHRPARLPPHLPPSHRQLARLCPLRLCPAGSAPPALPPSPVLEDMG